jgi:hypothetical protein
MIPDLTRWVNIGIAGGIVWACIPAMYDAWVRILARIF